MAVENYADELRGTPLERLAWTGELRRPSFAAAWALLVSPLCSAVFLRVSAVEIARFADPFAIIRRIPSRAWNRRNLVRKELMCFTAKASS